MDKTAILDSSALVALANPDDSTHDRASKLINIIRKGNIQIVLISAVFAETLNVLGKKIGHNPAIQFGNEIARSSEYIYKDTSIALHQGALEIWKNQKSSVSYTDCIVMATASEFDTKYILGFDEAFFANGYKLPV